MQLRLATLAGLALAACGGAPVAPTMTCLPPTCTPPANIYSVEVVGPSTVGSGEQQSRPLPNDDFNNVALDIESGYFAIGLKAAAVIGGQVTANGAPIAGTVIFTRPSHILGRPDVFYEATLDQAGRYSVVVAPNEGDEKYTVRVQPADPSVYPPTAVTSQITSSRTLDVSVAAGPQLVRLRGVITDTVGGPIGEARVVLRDATTQLDLSTVGVTDETGHFELALPIDAAALSSALLLAVERGDSVRGVLSLGIDLSPTELQQQLIDAALHLTLPPLQAPVHLSFAVLGAAANGVDKPVAGAQVLFRTNLLDPATATALHATHEIEAQTDSEGKVEVDLYPNDVGTRRYAVTIAPPEDSEFQSIETEVAVSLGGVGKPLRLGLRPLVTGRVLDPAGLPLKGAVVQPSFTTLAATSQATSLATTAKTPTANTDADGRFALRVDAGTYALGMIPSA